MYILMCGALPPTRKLMTHDTHVMLPPTPGQLIPCCAIIEFVDCWLLRQPTFLQTAV